MIAKDPGYTREQLLDMRKERCYAMYSDQDKYLGMAYRGEHFEDGDPITAGHIVYKKEIRSSTRISVPTLLPIKIRSTYGEKSGVVYGNGYEKDYDVAFLHIRARLTEPTWDKSSGVPVEGYTEKLSKTINLSSISAESVGYQSWRNMGLLNLVLEKMLLVHQ